MSHLSADWEVMQLRDVLKLEYGKPLPKEQREDDGAYPAYGANGVKCRTNQYYRKKPSIIVGRKGSAGELTLTEERYWPLDVTYFVDFDDERHDLMFLYYCLSSLNLQSLAKGVKPGINRNDVYAIECAFPPLPKQKRIVAILDEAFAGISQAVANAEKNLANARELFESYLNNVFSQKGDGWVETTISELVEKEILSKPLDGNHGEIHPKKADFVDVGVPFIMASDLLCGEVDQCDCNFISREQGDSLRKGFAKDGDVLLSHKGTIGRVAVLKTLHDYVMLTPQVTYYRIIEQDVLNNRYLYYFFQSPAFQREIGEIAGIGSTRAYIGITKQLNLHFSYPPLEEQKRLSAAFDVLVDKTQNLETVYQKKLTALAELKQSILQKAFVGELT